LMAYPFFQFLLRCANVFFHRFSSCTLILLLLACRCVGYSWYSCGLSLCV
jgi:hypothetical protein